MDPCSREHVLTTPCVSGLHSSLLPSERTSLILERSLPSPFQTRSTTNVLRIVRQATEAGVRFVDHDSIPVGVSKLMRKSRTWPDPTACVPLGRRQREGCGSRTYSKCSGRTRRRRMSPSPPSSFTPTSPSRSTIAPPFCSLSTALATEMRQKNAGRDGGVARGGGARQHCICNGRRVHGWWLICCGGVMLAGAIEGGDWQERDEAGAARRDASPGNAARLPSRAPHVPHSRGTCQHSNVLLQRTLVGQRLALTQSVCMAGREAALPCVGAHAGHRRHGRARSGRVPLFLTNLIAPTNILSWILRRRA